MAASAVWLCVPVVSEGQDPGVVAHRIPADAGERVALDGRLSEGLWSAAPPAGDFRQREPLEGEPATEPTEVRVLYDDDNLYVGIVAYDSEPERVVARILQRDKLMEPVGFGTGLQFAGDDGVAVLLDPFHDHRNAVIFATNANGAELEALLTDEGSLNIDWRGVWEVAAARTAEGWSAEIAIPWRTLRYPDTDGEPWGINVFRMIRRKNEETLLRSWQREGGGFHRVSRAAHLTGLEGLPRQGLNLEAKPFLLTGKRAEVDELGVRTSTGTNEAGLDLKSELRPGLLLDLTLNTDFAQVEVDDEQVNLTRFDLFFPEKREFFLENAGIFEFGVASNPFEPPAFQMFFSRRIGIVEGEDDEEAREVPILGGARLTGRVGAQTLGLLSVFTDASSGLPRERFSVARVKRDVGESGYVGAMVVDRRSTDTWNTATGVDAQYTLGEAWVLDGYVAGMSTGGGARGWSYRLAYEYTGERWGSFLNHLAVSPDAEAEAGFITRTDYRKTDLYGMRRWRPDALGLRKADVWVGGTYATTVLGSRTQDWASGVALNPEWESGETFTLMLNAAETVVDEAFELTDSVEVPVGRYRADHVAWFANTSRGRWISLGSNGMVSRFHGGHLASVGGTLDLAPSPRVALRLGFTRNDVSVPDGAFTADIASVRVSYSFSTRFTTNALVQYNSLDRQLSTNVRLNFIHRPGSDLFLVFTENRGNDERLWNLADRGVVMKATWLVRF